MSTLVAYSASAGSGKTFRITREYLKQLLRKPNASTGYRNILAVTFTNKATEEMKARIVSELNALAQGNEKKLRELCEELAAEQVAVSPEELQRRALDVRCCLLHDYSRFAVLTIDKFFQKVLHAFVNDVGLHPSFSLELDTARVLDEAVDAVVENVGGDEQLRAWLLQLQQQRLDSGKSWNVRDSLYELGQEIFKEELGRLSAQLQEKLYSKDFLQQYVQKLTAIKREVDEEMRGIAEKAKKYLRESGLTEDDFPYKSSGFIAHFRKIAQGAYEIGVRTLAAVNVIEKWSSKASRTARTDEAYNALNPLLARACQLWRDRAVSYNTADVILKNMMELGLLADIAQQVRSVASDENLLLISDTTALIASLVGDSDVPFIYEKVGSAYRTFMIDEFQDTSEGQWKNFLPLLSSSLAEDGLSMVVGDVKQSIYRWRNGDWRILAHGVDEDLGRFGAVSRRVLDKNFRSLCHVVEFNNELFGRLSRCLQSELNATLGDGTSVATRAALEKMITDAYADCRQIPQREAAAGGYVRVEFVEAEEEQRPADLIPEKLPLLVAELQDMGYRAGDIAILTRRRSEAADVAQALIRYARQSGDTEHCFDIVSQDSLLLTSSSVVKLCIALMRIAAGQRNDINEAFLKNERERYIKNEEVADLHALFREGLSDDEKAFLSRLTLRSLPEAFEAVVQRYRLDKLRAELPFLQALHELIITFSNRKLSDLSAFLDWWDKRGHARPLQSPEGQNAITITTLHKSKGLQYRVVIVPFADWDLDTKTGSTVWLRPEQPPFDEMPAVPLAYTRKLGETIFAEQQRVERGQAMVDSLNMLYVALTRAEEQLYLFAPLRKAAPGGGAPLEHIGQALHAVLSGLPEGVGGGVQLGALAGRKEGERVWAFGERGRWQGEEEASAAAHIPLDFYPSQSFLPKLRMRYEAREVLGAGAPSRRSSGTLKHKIFERMATAADIPAAVQQLLAEGFIRSKDEAAALQREVEQAVAQPRAAEWFSGAWRVYAEAEILLPAALHEQHHLVKRPDRVMLRDGRVVVVDYKFGENVEPAHARQVADYARCLRQMGYEGVEGYVWYVGRGEVRGVES